MHTDSNQIIMDTDPYGSLRIQICTYLYHVRYRYPYGCGHGMTDFFLTLIYKRKQFTFVWPLM